MFLKAFNQLSALLEAFGDNAEGKYVFLSFLFSRGNLNATRALQSDVCDSWFLGIETCKRLLFFFVN